MKDNNITKSNGLAGWIEDFINNFAKAKDVRGTSNERKKMAEINIKDLSEIIWNDELFYVYFDEDGATIFNAFGNAVTELPGSFTMEEVNEKLNSRQVVSSIEDNSLDVEADIETDELEVENIDEVLETEELTAYEEIAEEAIEETIEETTEEINEEIVEDVVEEEVLDNIDLEISELSNQVSLEELINKEMVKFEEHLTNVFETKMEELMEKMFARVNGFDKVDLNVEEVEIEKFTEEAAETVEQIEEENSIDRTTPEGKFTTEENEEVVEEVTEEIVEEEVVEEVAEEVAEEVELTEETIEEIAEEVIEELATENKFDEELEIVGNDADIFKEAKCPYCYGRLFKTVELEDNVEITCDDKDCNMQYVIDLNNGKIYIK